MNEHPFLHPIITEEETVRRTAITLHVWLRTTLISDQGKDLCRFKVLGGQSITGSKCRYYRNIS
jgi:hypothetical protein